MTFGSSDGGHGEVGLQWSISKAQIVSLLGEETISFIQSLKICRSFGRKHGVEIVRGQFSS